MQPFAGNHETDVAPGENEFWHPCCRRYTPEYREYSPVVCCVKMYSPGTLTIVIYSAFFHPEQFL